MSRADDPAFPAKLASDYVGAVKRASGLTKREYFAGLAMQALIPNYRTERSKEGDEALAFLAVKQAEALLAALSSDSSKEGL